MLVCPVCKGRTITVYGQNDEAHSAKCNDCGTFDALHKFEAAIIYPSMERVPENIFPPDDIVACVNRLHAYFVGERGAKQWAFGHVQSSDAPSLIGIEHVRNMAAAFMLTLVPHFSDELVEQLLEVAHQAAFGEAFSFASDNRKTNMRRMLRAALIAERG